VFCGRAGLTREHIFPKWLRKVAPEPEGARSYYNTGLQIHYRDGKQSPVANPTKHRTGGIQSHRLKIVCANCNNGWMSKLQSRTKPLLVPLINGAPLALSDPDRAILAAWATMFTMVVEFADPQTIATKQAEREDFAGAPRPLDNWIIWVGRAHQIRFNFMHFAWGNAVLKGAPVPEAVAGKADTQTTTFAVGSTFFHAYSTTASDPFLSIDATAFALRNGLFILWPRQTIPYADGGVFHMLTGNDVSRIANQLMNTVFPDYSKFVK
jgi:hypothetical protein